MGAPVKNLNAADESSAEALLTSLRTIDPAERRRHASVFNYWLSIRGDRPFPAIRDLDPLEISDAGPFSVLLEMIGGGEDAEIRHLGQAIRVGGEENRISEAQAPSLLSCIHAKLPIVAACRQAFAFEDQFETPDGAQRCWVTLLPLSANGTWIDFVYAFVSLDGASSGEEAVAEPAVDDDEPQPFEVELRPYGESDSLAPPPEPASVPVEQAATDDRQVDHGAEISDPEPETVNDVEPEPIEQFEPDPETERAPDFVPEAESPAKAGFSSKFLGSLASVGGFYGKVTQATPAIDPVVLDDRAEEQASQPAGQPVEEPPVVAAADPLHARLSTVRAMAVEAKQAQERSNLALYQGLSAAYDFALDAEDEPESYLRLVEAQGLKIQLRSPMKPVVKLAFADLCDDSTIGLLESVLAWALKMDLPRGSLADRIQAEGGIGQILATRTS